MSTTSVPVAIDSRPTEPVVRPTRAAWAGKGAMALIDQGLIAASNFLVALMLARQVSSAEYGAYALAFEIFLLLVVFYSSFILEPMSVFGPSIYKHCLRQYLETVLSLHLRAAAATCAVLGLAAFGVFEWSGNVALAKALAGVAVAGPCVLFFWIARRTFYLILAPASAAVGAAIYSAVLLCGLLVTYRLHLLSPITVFLLMGLGGLVTGPALMRRLKPVMSSAADAPALPEVVIRHWQYGRWALASSVATWANLAVLYFALTSFHGLAVTGELKALMNLASPIGQGLAALSLLSLPYASRVSHQESPAAMKRLATRLTLLYVGGTAAYFAVVLVIRHPLVRMMYGGKYLDVVGLLPLIALSAVLRLGATAQAIPLRAIQSPSLVFYAYGASAVVAVLAGIPASWAYGLRGAAAASVLSSAAALGFAYWLLRRSLNRMIPRALGSQAIERTA